MGADELAARRSRRTDGDSVQLIRACLLVAGGASVLAALLAVGGFVQLDSLLVLSKTIFNIITGIRQIGAGASLLFLGLAQALGLFALSLAAMIAVLAVASGMLRLLAHALPGLGTIWNLMARALNSIIGLLGFPQLLERQPAREARGPAPLSSGRRSRSAVPVRAVS